MIYGKDSIVFLHFRLMSKVFYIEGEQGGLRFALSLPNGLGALVSFPVVLLFLGVLWWLLGKIFPL